MIELPGRLIVQVHSAFEAYAPLKMTPEGSDSCVPMKHPFGAALGMAAFEGRLVDGLCKRTWSNMLMK